MPGVSRGRWLALLCVLPAFGFDSPDDPLPPLPPFASLSDPAPAARPATAWDDLLHPEREPRSVKSKSEGDWGSLSSQTVHADWHDTLLWEDPLRKREWKTNENWRCELLGPVGVFGDLGANSGEAAAHEMKVVGKTGVSCRLPLVAAAEVTVRSGPSWTYSDPLQPDRTKERSEWLLEVQARWPILAGVIGLEYDGTAAPALSAVDKNWIDHDVRFAIPVGTNGKVRLGAKHHWEGQNDSRSSASDSMQLYLGLELKR